MLSRRKNILLLTIERGGGRKRGALRHIFQMHLGLNLLANALHLIVSLPEDRRYTVAALQVQHAESQFISTRRSRRLYKVRTPVSPLPSRIPRISLRHINVSSSDFRKHISSTDRHHIARPEVTHIGICSTNRNAEGRIEECVG